MAATLVAAKSGIPCAHVEAGLRSRDLSMPEEINRLVTDRLANLLLTTSRDADVELLREGRDASDVVFVGNVMIDTLMSTMSSINSTEARRRLKVSEDAVVVTLHRPSNVDDPARLSQIISCLRAVAMRRQVVFFAHPRTLAVLGRSAHSVGAIDVRSPAEYRDLIALASSAPVVVTDSGGLQEETTVLGTPCLTLRDNTERPITVEQGTNRLVRDLTELERLVDAAVRPIAPPVIEGWDGRAGERVAHAILARSS
jgi:UDP-N-acetylglucosamine 2-epimerase (non-hydrolysing)